MPTIRPLDMPKLEKYIPSRFMKPTSYYDQKKADRAVRFVEMLHHTKGKWAGKPFWLLPWQEQIIRDIFGICDIETGKRQFHTAYIEIPKKQGKALALDTPMRTPQGWTTMGELKVGDQVYDEDGNPCNVVAKSDVICDENVYSLHFRDGSIIKAGASHQWQVEKGGVLTILNTRELYEYCQKEQGRFRIHIAAPLLGDDNPSLMCPPYAFGYWLGAGDLGSPTLHIPNGDYSKIRDALGKGVMIVKDTPKRHIVNVPDLKFVDMLTEKYIPQSYFTASISQRGDLLSGLIDSACTCRDLGQMVYSTQSERLVNDVSELLWGLGIKNNITASGKLFTLRWTMNASMKYGKLWRIRNRYNTKVTDTRNKYHYIKEIIKEEETIPIQCIQVDSISHLYLAGRTLVPTHNSELAAAVALYLLYADGEMSAEVYSAAADRQQASIVFDVAQNMIKMSSALLKRSKIMAAVKRIVNFANVGFYQVLSAEVGCVALDTQILMGDGSKKNAAVVKVGDIVASMDVSKGLPQSQLGRVSYVEKQPLASMVTIYTSNTNVCTTYEHPFWASWKNKWQWRPAEEIIPGMYVWGVGQDGLWGEQKVVKVEYHTEKQHSILIEVDGYDNHITNGILTHNSKHGLNVSGLVFDELHAQPNRRLWDVLTQGSGDAREQPLFFIITTAGTDRNSICFEQHQKAIDILHDRKVDPTFYPVVYGLADDEDWMDEKNWIKANPSIGITIPIERVREHFQRALDNPAEENAFKQLRLNMWVSGQTVFIPDYIWQQGNEKIDTTLLEGRRCYGGLDLSSTDDLSACVLVFPPKTPQEIAEEKRTKKDAYAPSPYDEKYVVLPWFWVPEATIPVRVRKASVPYDIWVQSGYLYATEGNVIHYGEIEAFIDELGKIYHIEEIAFDRWGATQMTQDLTGMGYEVIPFGQGFASMSPPTKEFYKLCMEGKVIHGGHPILKWMAGNVVIDTDPAGNIKPTKAKSPEKIDGIVATIMALDRCLRHEYHESIYDNPNRGLMIF